MTAANWILCVVASYFLGSIPTGFVWGKARGIDIRKVGSGNIGATNVMRALGKIPGITVLLIDALKGFVPVYFAPACFPEADKTILQIVCCVADGNGTAGNGALKQARVMGSATLRP